MRSLITLILIVGSSVAITANMTAVSKEKGFCRESEASICDEWVLVADKSIRIVEWGYEDGGWTKIFRVDRKGTYVPVAEVIPVLQDSSRPGVLLNGNGEISGIVLSRVGKVLAVRGTYKRKALSDEETDGTESKISHDIWRPLVLFTGKATPPARCDGCTPPDMNAQSIEWRSITLDELGLNDRKRINEVSRIAEEELRQATEASKKH
jgi:hypothetical protein